MSGRLTRRAALRLAGGTVGLSWPAWLLARAESGRTEATEFFGRAKRCLLLFLTGGPPQHDTFDPKPDAPSGIRGELRPIATRVTGVQVSELCPMLARQAERFCIVRSVTHGDSTHTSAGYTMLTGAYHPRSNAASAEDVRPSVTDHPHLGSVVSRSRPPADGTPPFASIPEIIKDAAVNEFPGQGAGFLGKRFDPFRIDANEQRNGFRLPNLVLDPDVTSTRLIGRQTLLERFEELRRPRTLSHSGAEFDGIHQNALDLIRAPAVTRALRLEEEPEHARARYGDQLFGQSCLLGRRLLEAGVPLVSVYWHYEGPDDSPVWDTHENNFRHLRERLAPPADRAIAAVFQDLVDRGMLDDTLVICMGEFGRTPKINGKAGRDHWPHVQSVLLAGAGIHGGSVYGASDRLGAYPADNPVTPPDLIATFLHLLGVRPELEVNDRTGRAIRVCHGTPITRLFA